MSLTTRYCEFCGRKLKIIETGLYDKWTGEKEFDYVECEVQDCIHGHHTIRKRTFKEKYCRPYAKGDHVCLICNKPLYLRSNYIW